MAIRFAFAGFRHAHINSLYASARKRPDTQVVAACEEHEPTRQALVSRGAVEFTHQDIGVMLDSTPCDVVAIGDYYARRGELAIRALARGRHVIADKPFCTRLEDLDEIERLARVKGLKIGCMLDMRDGGQWIGLRRLLLDGRIGEVHAISFGGQHPLMYGSRPGWYFEPGKHGGTWNDIAIHAMDYIPWATGLRFVTVNAARGWNAFAEAAPHFQDAAQAMLTMDNGCGVLGDVSYFAPDSMGYSMPWYWRMTFWGRKGVAEACSTSKKVMLGLQGEKEVQLLDPPAGSPDGYLNAFLADVAGRPDPEALNTEVVLRATRQTLLAQRAADQGLREVAV